MKKFILPLLITLPLFFAGCMSNVKEGDMATVGEAKKTRAAHRIDKHTDTMVDRAVDKGMSKIFSAFGL